MHAPLTSPGRLAANVVHFARVLRTAGLPVGTDRIELALQALRVTGLESRTDLHDVLVACLIDRIEHRLLFDQAFELFWRNPEVMARLHALLLPQVRVKEGARPAPPQNRRLGVALFPHMPAPTTPPPPERVPLELDARLTWSDREQLRKVDFETMSTDEWAAARKLLAELPLAFEPMRTRRMRAAPHAGRPDWRATLRAMARQGGQLWSVRWQAPRMRPAPLVVLADISGSMSRYSRMLLHFAHALGRAGAHVESFTFGTRLSRISRLLRHADPDLAVQQVVRAVDDWSGGTRLAACLREFNRRWARRVLPAHATVLLITDGLAHDDADALAEQMQQLRRSCQRVLWLNPLLRFEHFEPRAAGVRAMLPHVDRMVAAHTLDSLADLAQTLAAGLNPTHSRARYATQPAPDPARGPGASLGGPA